MSLTGGVDGLGLSDAAFRRYHRRIYRYLLRRTGNHHDAEELTQRVFVDAATTLEWRQERPRSTLAWLYAVAHRRFVDEMRQREHRRELLPRMADRPAAASVGDLVDERELTRAILQALNRLPADQREVVLLRFFDGHRFAEIARELGTSEAACKMRLTRAVRAVHADLERRGFSR